MKKALLFCSIILIEFCTIENPALSQEIPDGPYFGQNPPGMNAASV